MDSSENQAKVQIKCSAMLEEFIICVCSFTYMSPFKTTKTIIARVRFKGYQTQNQLLSIKPVDLITQILISFSIH